MNYNTEGEPLMEVPEVEVETEMGPLVLTWINTVVRTYREEVYNHVEYMDDAGIKTGFLTPKSVIEVLIEHEFPYSYQPIVDKTTLDWYVGVQTEQLSNELEQL